MMTDGLPMSAAPSGPLAIVGPTRDLGGFHVRRILPSPRRRLVGPFIFFDHMGPVDFPPGQGIDVRPHPHIGLATVTYLFEGEILHRDSLGVVQPIEPGAVNWMTSGRGIAHSERTGPEQRARGGRLHGIQSWVALPREREEDEPGFQHHAAAALPVIEQPGVQMRLIAGEAYGARSPVTVASSMFYLDAALVPGAALALPGGYEERAIYLVEGAIRVDGETVTAGTMLVLDAAAAGHIQADENARLMLLGGAPLESPRHIWWNFVSSSPERIEQAKADWKAGRFARVPVETEFIPLPEG
jgi:redox-sensitive bicupin YhaK (pirin superfamily)